MLRFVEAPEEKTLCEIAEDTYGRSLAQYHARVIQTAVGLAFHALPYRAVFVDTLIASQPAGTDLNSHETFRTFFKQVGIPAMQKVYDVTQALLTQANMLNLP